MAGESQSKESQFKETQSKAFTATVNRIAKKFGVQAEPGGSFHIIDPPMTLRVATTATLGKVVDELASGKGDVFVVMTNREAIKDAVRAAGPTKLGVMDPHGDIVKPAGQTVAPLPASRRKRPSR